MMDTNNLKRFISIFMLVLIVLMPIDISISVSAFTKDYGSGYVGEGGVPGVDEAFLRIKSLTGNYGYEDFRKQYDYMKVVVQASLGKNTTLGPENLELYLDDWAIGKFDSCTEVSGQESIYECIFQETDDTAAPVSTGYLNYEVRLVSEDQLVRSVIKQIVVDGKAPIVSRFDLEETKTNKENITLNFMVKDYSFGVSPGIGIKSIDIKLNEQNIYSYPESNINESDIIRKTSINEQIVVPLPKVSGINNICINALDYYDYAVEKCYTIEVDVDAPKILPASLKVTDNSDQEYEWVRERAFPLKISIDYIGDDINLNSIYANFSNLNKNPMNKIKGSCQKQDVERYTCTFNLNGKINSSGSRSLIFYGEDLLGNPTVSRLSTSFKYDATGPIPKTFSTPYYYNGYYYIGKAPTEILITYEEDGIGMNNSNANANFAGLGSFITKKADICSPSWKCSWTGISSSLIGISNWRVNKDSNVLVKAKEVEVIALGSTVDDMNNLGKSKKFKVIADVYKPEILDITVKKISGNDNDFGENYTIQGDSLYLEFNLSEASFVDMNISARDFIPRFEDSIRCTDEGDGTHLCQYILGPIVNEGPYVGTLKFTFTDILGNTLEHEETVEVLGVEEGKTDYWSGMAFNCKPNPLDRKIVEDLSTDAYCPIKLNADRNVDIFDLSEGGCELVEVDDSDTSNGTINPTLKHYNWMGLATNNRNLYMNLVIDSFNPRIDGMTYNCQIKIRSFVNEQILTKQYETINISIPFKLFNNPVGELNDTVWNKATEVYDNYIGGGWSVVGSLESIVRVSKKLCELKQKIEDIMNGLKIASKILNGVGGVLKGSVYSEGAGIVAETSASDGIEGSRTGIKEGYQNINEAILSPYCKFISCRLAFLPAYQNIVQRTLAIMMNPLNGIKLINKKTKWGNEKGIDAWAFNLTNGAVNNALGINWDTVGSKEDWTRSDELEKKDKEIVPKRSTRDYGSTKSKPSQKEVGKIRTFLGNALQWLSGNRNIPKETTEKTSSPATASVTADVVSNRIVGKVTAPSSSSAQKKNTKEQDSINWMGDVNLAIDPYENYVNAVLSLCVPAMIHNLEKYRQIQCEYGKCLLNSAYGQPLEVCSSNKEYAECKFIYGPLFELIPFAKFMSTVQETIASFMTDESLWIDVALKGTCSATFAAWVTNAKTPISSKMTQTLHFLCDTYEMYSYVADRIADFEAIKTNGAKQWAGLDSDSLEVGAATGVCGEFAKKYEEIKES